MGWLEWTWSLAMLPFRFTYVTLFELFNFFFGFLFRRPLAVTDPEGDVRNFISLYETAYGAVHPPFYTGAYSSALNDAKRDLRYLLVYLHSPQHQDTDAFCRDTLANRELIDFLATRNVMFWACSVKSAEGYRVSMALRESSYPFVALVCMRDGRMAMVLRVEGATTADHLIGALATAMHDNDAFMGAARMQREQQQLDQRLRREQEEAYQHSLSADRRAQEVKDDEQRRREREEADEQRLIDVQLEHNQELERRRVEVREALPPEPEAGTGTDRVRVSLKFPDGTRYERTFLQTDSLELLFNTAFSHSACPLHVSLFTSYPKRELRCQPDWYCRLLARHAEAGFDAGGGAALLSSQQEAEMGTFESAGLIKSSMILVHDNDA